MIRDKMNSKREGRNLIPTTLYQLQQGLYGLPYLEIIAEITRIEDKVFRNEGILVGVKARGCLSPERIVLYSYTIESQ